MAKKERTIEKVVYETVEADPGIREIRLNAAFDVLFDETLKIWNREKAENKRKKLSTF